MITIYQLEKKLGTVKLTDNGLEVKDESDGFLEALLTSMRQDRTDKDLYDSLVDRLNGRTYAIEE